MKTIVLLVIGLLALARPAHAAGLTLDRTSYAAAETLAATFSGGPGNNDDWIGIFPASVTTPSTGAYLTWRYTNNTQTASGSLQDGTVTFPAAGSLAPGSYKAWFLADNGYTVLAGPVAFTVTSGAGIGVDRTTYTAADPIVVNFSGGPGNNNDWIGIFPASVTTPSTGAYLNWLYTNGTRSASGKLKNGSVTFPNAAGLSPGSYKVWFLAENGYTMVAGPATFSVAAVGGPTPPAWLLSPFALRHAVQGQAYTGRIGAYAYDPDLGDAVSFSKVSGPSWLSISATGELTGTPAAGDTGTNTFTVAATDLLGNATNATLTLPVFASGAEQVAQVKVMSYNLFHGWGNMDDGQKKGLDSVILSGADIIGTQETVDNVSGSNANQAQAIAQELGWYYSPTGSGDSGIASRYPIVATYTSGVAKGVRIRICSSPLREVILFNTHLDYLHYGPYAAKASGSTNASVLAEELASQRDEQIAAILSGMSTHLAGANTTPVFLTGDFNCPSHLDWTAANSSAHYGKIVVWPVTKAIADAGMTDSLRQVYPNPVTHPMVTWSPLYNSPNEPQDRIDFVFHKGSGVTPVAAQMFTTPVEHSGYAYGDSIQATRANTWPSDHAAVVVIFQFGP